MFNLKQVTLGLSLLLIIMVVKIIKQNTREVTMKQSILELKAQVSTMNLVQAKAAELSVKLDETVKKLQDSLNNNKNLQKKIEKTRDTLDASIRSLKSSNAKKDECVKQTSKILLDKENTFKEKEELTKKVKILGDDLANKQARLEELAKRLENVRIENNKEMQNIVKADIK